jgi:dolichol-phosphate mannosyltransferase
MQCLVIIPTYNEALNLPQLLPLVFKYAPEVSVLIVDDSSPDGTGAVVEKMAGEHPGKIFLLERPAKSGLASAYLEGFAWGLARDFDYFMEMDADSSHRPIHLHQMLDIAEDYDFVIGSRNIPGGAVVGWSGVRNFISKGGSLYSRLVLHCPIRDLTGGFNLWSRHALETIGLDNIISRGYLFQIEMKYRAYRKGLTWTEVPIIFHERALGKSKMSKRIFFEALLKIWKLRFAKI